MHGILPSSFLLRVQSGVVSSISDHEKGSMGASLFTVHCHNSLGTYDFSRDTKKATNWNLAWFGGTKSCGLMECGVLTLNQVVYLVLAIFSVFILVD